MLEDSYPASTLMCACAMGGREETARRKHPLASLSLRRPYRCMRKLTENCSEGRLRTENPNSETTSTFTLPARIQSTSPDLNFEDRAIQYVKAPTATFAALQSGGPQDHGTIFNQNHEARSRRTQGSATRVEKIWTIDFYKTTSIETQRATSLATRRWR